MINKFGGDWTDEKLRILEKYLTAYTTALKNQPFRLIYVDAFAGSGEWEPSHVLPEGNDSLKMRKGSVRIALDVVDKSFDEFLFIDKNASFCEGLRSFKRQYPGRYIDVRNGNYTDK